uniref:Cytoskeleton-associated protein 5 n=1 Tax=Elaeophora elaphi TaxID=1147741 RepID=A0A0R3RZL0_9BILA
MDDWSLLSEVNVLAKLPGQFNEWLESKKWTERRDALQALINEMAKTPRLDTKVDYFNITQSLRNVLAKDANINVCALAAKCITGLANGLRTKFAQFATLYIPVIFERFKEKKPTLRDPLIECIDTIALTVNLDMLVDELSGCLNKPNPHIKLQACNFIYRVMKNYSQASAPKKSIKAVTPILVKFTADPDPEVREAACVGLGSIMRLTGDKVMNTFLGNLQEDKSKMKKICDSRDQATTEYNEEAKRKQESVPCESVAVPSADATAVGPIVAGTESAAQEIDPWDMLDPVDVLAKLPANFMEGTDSKKWIDRRDALQSLLVLCTENPKLCPKANYGEFVALLKKILEKDANINVCALAARCLTAFATGLRKKFAQYATMVAPTIFEKFKEKKPVLRDPLIDCIDAVAASTTLEALAEDIQTALDKQNPHIKIQTNLFLYRVFKRHNPQTVPKKVLKSLAPIIVKLTGDSDPEVRDASYAALGAAMKAVGEKSCMVLLADIAEDKMKMTKIRDFCEKAVQEAGTDVVSIMVQSIHKSNPENGTGAGNANPNSASPLKPPAPGVGNSNVGGKARSKEIIEEDNMEEKPSKTSKKESETAKEPEESMKPKDEFLVLKWNFDQPGFEHVEQLKTLLGNVTQASLLTFLFNKDFKQQLKGIDILQSLITDCPESLISNSDLLLKWISLRFFETNPTVLLKVLDLTQGIFSLLLQYNESFSEQEMYSFVPYLLLKLGEAKDSVRTPVRTIIQLVTELVSPPKIFPLIIEGLKTKNSRQRTECLQVLEQLLDTTGMAATTTPAQSLKQIAACIDDRDNNVRNAAINAIVVAWKEEGDRVFQLIGKMNDKSKAMLDERIKRSGVVSKARGGRGPERIGTSAKRNANISIGIKGRGLRSDRSSSRVGRNTHRSNSVSRDSSPVEDKENNRTFTMQRGDDQGNDNDGTRKRFALNLDLLKLDNNDGAVEYPEIDINALEMLEPIEPAIRKRKHPPQYSDRAESVSSLTSLESAAGDVDKVVHGVASMSQATATAAISQLQFLFGDPSNFRYVADRTDAVVQAIVTQSSIIRSRHLDDVSALDELNELVRTICHFLSSLIKETTTCSRISSEALKMLIQEFLYLLKDERMEQLKDIQSIFRSLNYLSIRICDNADPTACFLALCSMLTSALHDPRNKTVELINKCIYKQSELFLRDVPMNLDEIVKAIHVFMQEFRPRVDENKNIKSSMHSMELCIQRLVAGTKSSVRLDFELFNKRKKEMFVFQVIQHIGEIPNPDSSEAVIYMRKCVRGLQNKSNQNSLASSAYGELPGQVLSSNYEESVRNLISKIIENPFGKSLRLLHTFLKMNPDARKTLEEELKKHFRMRDFIILHLKKMDLGDRETPEVTDELYNVMESIRAHREALCSYRQTGWWTGNAANSLVTSANENAKPMAVRRSFQRQVRYSFFFFHWLNAHFLLPLEGAPENEPVTPVHAKSKLTASDVEPLKQLLNMRRQQQ